MLVNRLSDEEYDRFEKKHQFSKHWTEYNCDSNIDRETADQLNDDYYEDNLMEDLKSALREDKDK